MQGRKIRVVIAEDSIFTQKLLVKILESDPDIEVEFRPQDYAAGIDPQMDRAVREIKKILRGAPKRPDLTDRPRLTPERLPAAKA